MKTILVPIDLSDVAEYGLDTAAEIAKQHNATIVLLNRVEVHSVEFALVDSIYHETKEDYYQYLTKDNKERIQDTIEKPKYAGVKFKFRVVRDNEPLADIVTSQNADLIVMGSSGATGWKEWVRGSNAESVVRDANCPVMVVKSPTTDFKRVVFTLDFENLDFIKSGVELFGTEGVEYFFVFVDDGMHYFQINDLREKLGKIVLEVGLSNYQFEVFNDNTIDGGIVNYAHLMGADLIVMRTHGRKGFEHFIHGSIAADVVNHADTAVLVYH
ncbi:MAG: universal stress protein [Spirosomaceae bacterium]|jgi:nucleotide-binding universal stress UspA family protein|nr:universal stress protein [Spirosomataceae bacterium]